MQISILTQSAGIAICWYFAPPHPGTNRRMLVRCGRHMVAVVRHGYLSIHIRSLRHFDKLTNQSNHSGPAKAHTLFPVAVEDRIVGVDAAVTEEWPASADIFSAVKINVHDLHALLLGPELRKYLTLRPCGE